MDVGLETAEETNQRTIGEVISRMSVCSDHSKDIEFARVLPLNLIHQVKPKSRKFRHYKGGVYERMGVAIQESTGVRMVIYRGGDGVVWARPKKEWNEFVAHKGKMVKRFSRLK